MHIFLPEFIVENAKDKNYAGKIEASVLSVDLNGFDSLINNLLKSPDNETDSIFEVMNYVFTPLIEVIRNHGGLIAVLTSNSLTAIFPGNNKSGAINAAIQIRDFLRKISRSIKEFGYHSISANIFMVNGCVEWFVLPGDHETVYWFTGPAMEKLVLARSNPRLNQIVMGKNMLDNTKLQVKRINREFCILEEAEITEEPNLKENSRLVRNSSIFALIRDLEDKGKIQNKLCCYINLSMLIEDHLNTILSLCAQYRGFLSRVDPVDKGWSALMLFDVDEHNDKKRARVVNLAMQLQVLCKENIRISLTSGKVYSGIIETQQYSNVVTAGLPVDLAERLMKKAGWGEIWCDGNVHKLAEVLLDTEEVELLRLEEDSEEIEVWRLYRSNERKEFSHYLTDFIGRNDELEKLERSCNPLWEGENAGITYIYGEAGQGKSRLVHQFKQMLGNRVEFFFLITDSMQQTPLNPFSNWIKSQFTSKIARSLSEYREDFRSQWSEFMQKVEKITHSKQIIKELERIESIIAGMIGLEWEGSVYSDLEPKYRATVKGFAFKSLMEILSMMRPIVLVIDNIQWLDQESEEILMILTRRTTTMPCKVILTSRSLDNGDYPQLKFDNDVKEERIYLGGLDEEQSSELIESILQRDVSPEIVRYVYSLSNGNPLLIEQMTQYLETTGRLEIRNDCFYLKDQSFELPKGLMSAIVSRLNRLGPELKKTVQIASVLGTEFSAQILYEMLETQEKRTDYLNISVVRTQLLLAEQEHIWHATSESTYIFNHSLLCDVVYKMQSRQRLKQLHLLAAQILRTYYSEYKLMLAKVAEHYEKSGEWELAVEFYTQTGDYYKEQCYFIQSLKNFEKALLMLKKTAGDRSLEKAELLSNIATVYYLKGDFDKALDCHQQVLGIREKLLNPKSLEVANSYREISDVYIKKSDHVQGLKYTEKALAIYKEKFDDEKLEIAVCLHNLAAVYKMKNEYTSALEYFQQANQLTCNIYGEEHFHTAKNLTAIGAVYTEIGDIDQAITYHERAKTIYESTIGKRRPQTAISYYNLGINHIFKGKMTKALDYLEQALAIQRDIFGERHSDTSDTVYCISVVYSRLGDIKTSLAYYKEALSINKELFGERHPNTAAILNGIGSMYIKKGDFNKASGYIQKALSIDQETLGEKHPQTTCDLINMGIIYGNKGDQERALRYLEKALSLQKEIFGEKDFRTGYTMNFIGEMYIDKGDIDKALEYVLRSLTISTETLGERHNNTAVSLHILGDIYIEKGDYVKARSYLEQALDISNENVGPNHIQTAHSMNSMGLVYLDNGDFEKALSFIEKALKVFKKHVEMQHPGLLDCLKNIGKVYLAQKKYDKALDYFQQLYSIRKETFGEKHQWTIEAISEIVNTCEKMGDRAKALEYQKLIQ